MKTEQGQIKFTENFTGLCEVFNKKYSTVLLDIYYRSLKNNSINEVEMAIKQAITDCKFFPVPAELLEFIPSQKQVSAETKAQIEADKIVSHLNQYGGSKTPKFTDPITRYLMSSRWVYQSWASQILEKDIVWFLKDFIAAYTSYNEVGDSPQIEASKDVLKLAERIG